MTAVPPRLTDAVKRLRTLKDYKEELEDKLKEVNKEAKDLQERVIPRLMEDSEIEKATIEGAGTIYVKQELYVSMLPAFDEEAEAPFYSWARENAPDLIKPYIHPGRLKSFCKESLENGVALPDNMIKATFVPMGTLLRR
jgi:hypothetical protein